MAAIAGNKQRENIHTDIGFVGRKTGFMVQSDLIRDDNGMENMSAFFSPTSNAGTLPNLADDDEDSIGGDFEEDQEDPESDLDLPSDFDPRGNGLSTNDESAPMDMEESTAKSVTAVLESRKGINTPARRKSMHSAHATPNLPLSSVTPQSNISTPAIRRPKSKATSKATSSQLSKPVEQNEEARGSFGSHKENVPNSFDSRQSDEAPVEAPAPRQIPLGARASGLRAAGGRGGSSMLVAKSLKATRPAITPPPLSDDDDDDDDEPLKFNEEPTLDDTEMDVIPAPQPKPKTTQRPAADPAQTKVQEASNQKTKPGRKEKANVTKAIDEAEGAPAPTASKSDKPAAQKRGRKPKATEIVDNASEPEAPQADKEGADTLDEGIPDMEPEEIEENTAAEPSPPKKGKGGRKKKQAPPDTETEMEPQSSTSNNVAQKKKGGRPKKITEPEPELEEEPTQVDEPEPQPKSQKTKGRPKRSKQDALAPDQDTEPQEEPVEEPAEQSQPENTTERKRGRKRKAETLIPETEPDTQGSSTAETNAAKKQKSSKQTAAKPVAEKPQSSKSNTAKETEGRKSGRSRTAPLQFWKNEKQVYKVVKRDDSGRAVTLAADVVRVDDEPVAPKKKARPWRPVVVSTTEKVSKRPTKKKTKEPRKAVEEASSESEDGDSEDDWEQVGKLVGMVRQWAPDNNEEDGEDDEEVEDEIATSRHGIEFKPIFGSDYLFAKTLGKPFMGCGILELQTGASKKLKSSGKMQLVFFILKGKVEAEVNELGFRISHGGQFQVPRGNMYKISNPFKKTARIFFAQACIPDPETEAA
ncbi:hypothetical protein TWF718_001329 [Orbilia javanica]|uniref:CENP-C homolog n=1 Tax=Orbilia javanica TaxID=47235 RepID=A0AAN8RMP5_9PEZI